MRIVEVMIDAAALEFSKFMRENRHELGIGFASGSIDFWEDPHRREHFGAMIIDVLAKCYALSNDRHVFMSDETKSSLALSKFKTGAYILFNLENIQNFQAFPLKKTCKNVSDWIEASLTEGSIEPSDFVHLSADGAANAVGSLSEFEASSRASHPNGIDFEVCYGHQNEHAGGKASGTLKFAEDPNPELGVIL